MEFYKDLNPSQPAVKEEEYDEEDVPQVKKERKVLPQKSSQGG